MHDSHYMTNQLCGSQYTTSITNLRRLLATKFFSSSRRWRSRRCLITKPYGAQTQQLKKVVGCKTLWCTQYTTSITNLRRLLAVKFFSSSKRWRSRRCLVTKPYGAQTRQLLHMNNELGKILSPVTICLNKLCATFVQLVSTLMALKIIILYV